jgi:hypothetical protein
MRLFKILFLALFILEANVLHANNLCDKFSKRSFEISKIIKPKQKGRKTKDGRFKRKKGFMWGLFKSKKECDCPK